MASQRVASDAEVATRRTLSPFERLLEEKNRHDQSDDDRDGESDDVDDDGLTLCEIPEITKYTSEIR